MSASYNVIDSVTTDRSVKVLVLANILSLLAAWYFSWDIFTLMLLYWVETAIIGVFTVIKILHTARFLSIFLVPFFCVHFGMFMFVHLTFLYALFGDGTDLLNSDVLVVLRNTFSLVALPALALFASHLYSFLANYLGKREFYSKGPMAFFAYPYPRIIVMHLTIIFGGFLAMLVSPQLALVLMGFLKTVTDVLAHRKMHSKKDRMWGFKRLR